MISFWSSVTASLVAFAGCVYLFAANIVVARSVRKSARPPSESAPAVTVLKPLHGDEPGLLENLTSFCTQDYSGQLQIIFGVEGPNDGAVPVVRCIQKNYSSGGLELVIGTSVYGINRKVSNLVNMGQRIQHDVVVIADSDMRVDPNYLSRVIAALNEPGVAAVTCLYYGVPVSSIWASISALAINAHFLPSVVFGAALGLARPCFGSTIALRRLMLGEIGGFTAFVDCLADDYAMGVALRARGRQVSIPPFAIAHMCTQSSPGELWQQELRWARTIMSINFVGYLGSFVAHPLPWALIAALLGAGSTALYPAIAIALASIVLRIGLLRQVERAYALPLQAYWLVPVRDILSFIIFVTSFLGRDVSWKGRRYRALARGNKATDRESNPP